MRYAQCGQGARATLRHPELWRALAKSKLSDSVGPPRPGARIREKYVQGRSWAHFSSQSSVAPPRLTTQSH
eukprot:14327027-Alexandrium_andersonii.AAC.1